jgi:hypothetical protein
LGTGAGVGVEGIDEPPGAVAAAADLAAGEEGLWAAPFPDSAAVLDPPVAPLAEAEAPPPAGVPGVDADASAVGAAA